MSATAVQCLANAVASWCSLAALRPSQKAWRQCYATIRSNGNSRLVRASKPNRIAGIGWRNAGLGFTKRQAYVEPCPTIYADCRIDRERAAGYPRSRERDAWLGVVSYTTFCRLRCVL